MNRKIILCEDSEILRNTYLSYIDSYLAKHEFGEVTLVSDDPLEILKLVEADAGASDFVYVLDIELNREMNGMVLAKKIRALDQRGDIIFITSHGEYIENVFQHMLRALGYIDKSTEVESRLILCLENIRLRPVELVKRKPQITIQGTDRTYTFNPDDIIAVEGTDYHKVVIQKLKERLEIRATLGEAEKALGDSFLKIHKSYSINTDYYVGRFREKRDMWVELKGDIRYKVARSCEKEVQKLD